MIEPTVSVVLPTYKRPEMLRLCLSALLQQTLRPVEICIGRRTNDRESADVLAEFAERSNGTVREAVVAEDGNLVASMNAALALTTGDLVALTDDDAEAPPDWLVNLRRQFADPSIAGVGGRDWQPHERWDEQEVGIVRLWGKVIGNHHLGAGPTRDVDLLKGVNCCFRGELIRQIGFDKRLLGVGNVSHWEMHLCFVLRRAGWRLVYDPQIVLDHNIGPRYDGDSNARGGFEPESYTHAVHNCVLALLEYLPAPRRSMYRAWQTLVGTRGEPGMLQVIRLLLKGQSIQRVLAQFQATRRGSRLAYRRWRTGRSNAVPIASPTCSAVAEPHTATHGVTQHG